MPPPADYDLAALFLLDMVVVLAACRLVGRLVQPLGQPPVVGEMIAGVVLGPSLFGWLAPDWHAQLFPKPALTVLYCVAQVGLVLYMFLVGLRFDLRLVRRNVKSAAAVSLAGILAPLALGAALAWHLRGNQTLFTPGIAAWEGMLFLGAAMSITAFPMLARMIHEAGISGTPLGTLALTAGSVNDAAAWCLLALVLAGAGGQASIAFLAVGGGLGLALFAFLVLRPLLARAAGALRTAEVHDRWGLPGTLVLLMLTAWFAHEIGMHAVFGAFVLGSAMPRGPLAERLENQLAPLTTSLLLPLFFASSGLKTHLGLLDSAGLWGVALLVLAAACLGKGVAGYAAARWCGEAHAEALAIGSLMNARGLTELIFLNIGLERGILTPTLFSMMVIMTLVTTLGAMPVFGWVYGRRLRPAVPVAQAA